MSDLILPSMAPQTRVGAEDLHRFSLDEYHRLIDAGAFDEDLRAELIDGLLVDRSQKTPEHERVIQWLTRWLILSALSATHSRRVTSPAMASPEEHDWRRAARRRFLWPLALAVVGILVAVLTSGVGEIVGWGIVAVAITIAISLVFLEVGLSEDREREREARRRR